VNTLFLEQCLGIQYIVLYLCILYGKLSVKIIKPISPHLGYITTIEKNYQLILKLNTNFYTQKFLEKLFASALKELFRSFGYYWPKHSVCWKFLFTNHLLINGIIIALFHNI